MRCYLPWKQLSLMILPATYGTLARVTQGGGHQSGVQRGRGASAPANGAAAPRCSRRPIVSADGAMACAAARWQRQRLHPAAGLDDGPCRGGCSAGTRAWHRAMCRVLLQLSVSARCFVPHPCISTRFHSGPRSTQGCIRQGCAGKAAGPRRRLCRHVPPCARLPAAAGGRQPRQRWRCQDRTWPLT